jgi:hypothetical protein
MNGQPNFGIPNGNLQSPDQNFMGRALSGTHYLEVLKNFHRYLRPKTYFEIGTNTGSSLDYVECPSIAIDPRFILKTSATGSRPATLFFQTTSDLFFRNYDPRRLLNDNIDLAFLDGLHEAEALLRDFYNTEKHCNPNSIIVLHDCVPTHRSMLSRADNGGGWTGDVWKIVCILKEYRPDIDIHIYDAAPTGLVCCTNLNPNSTSLRDNYSDIWRKWSKIDMESYGYEKYITECDIQPTNSIASPEEIRRYYWL